MNRGVLYLSVGQQYVDEAKRSLESFRRFHDIPAAIITDDASKYDLTPFAYIVERGPQETGHREGSGGERWIKDSLLRYEESPFDTTLYLDTDTRVCGDLNALFESVQRYDIAMVQLQDAPLVYSLPDPVGNMYNTGVICYRKTDNIKRLFKTWNTIFNARIQSQPEVWDQPSFCEAVYLAKNLRVLALPNRYNVRVTPGPRRGSFNGEPKVLHGRDDLERAEAIFKNTPYDHYNWRSTSWSKPVTLRRTSASLPEEVVYRAMVPIQDLRWSLDNDDPLTTLKRSMNRLAWKLWPQWEPFDIYDEAVR